MSVVPATSREESATREHHVSMTDSDREMAASVSAAAAAAGSFISVNRQN